MATGGGCPTCGRPLDLHSPDYRFTLPDPVLALPEREKTEGTWMSHADAGSSVMMQVPNCGAFVRALLPVRLTDGHSAMFGLWIGVPPDSLQHAARIWWEPDYVDLTLDGLLANDLPLWGLLGAPVRAAVRDPDHTPYCESSSDPELTNVLTKEWPHAQVLEAIGI